MFERLVAFSAGSMMDREFILAYITSWAWLFEARKKVAYDFQQTFCGKLDICFERMGYYAFPWGSGRVKYYQEYKHPKCKYINILLILHTGSDRRGEHRSRLTNDRVDLSWTN